MNLKDAKFCSFKFLVNEEFSESGFSVTPSSVNQTNLSKHITNENSSNQATTNHQSKPSSTSLGTTLSNGANEISDDEIGLIRRRSTGSSKKKAVGSGILRTLFRFGSKKFKDKDKQQKLNNPQNIKELGEKVEELRARKAAIYEQEVIQEYYKRLIDQQKFQQIVSQQAQQRQQILNTPTNCTLNNTLKKQSVQRQTTQQQQQYKKQQDQNAKNLYVMENANQNVQPYLNLQSNYMPNLHTNSNQVIMNKQATNYDANYLQTGYAVQNRPSVGLVENSAVVENQRPKSSYLTGGLEQNNILVNQNGYQTYGSSYYQDLGRKVKYQNNVVFLLF